MTTRLLPPASGNKTHTVNGRTYAGVSAATPVDAPDFDVIALEANGWTALGLVGATAQRPVNPQRGQRFIDTTLSKTIYFDGAAWRDHTGAAV